jgi:hypothetical protein
MLYATDPEQRRKNPMDAGVTGGEGQVLLPILCAVVALPAVGGVLLLDSVSKEPYGGPLYFGTLVGGFVVSQLLAWLVRPATEGSTKPDAFGRVLLCYLLGTWGVAFGVAVWLFASGH